MLQPLIDPSLEQISTIKHGFFSRIGGVSLETYAHLNCSYYQGDHPSNVHHNRTMVAQYFNVEHSKLATVKQVHNNTVVTIGSYADMSNIDQVSADAIVTKLPQVILGGLSADCPIILLARQLEPIIAVAHAGWRGALNGIIGKTISAMHALGGTQNDIVAAISPCIQQQSYAVGPDLYEEFLTQDTDNKQYFHLQQKHKWQFDLLSYVIAQLRAAAVHTISSAVAYDTYTNPQLFFSYRYAAQHSSNPCGRNLSAIMLLKSI